MTIESYRTMGSYKKGHQDSVVLHNIGAYGTGGERTRGGGGVLQDKVSQKRGPCWTNVSDRTMGFYRTRGSYRTRSLTGKWGLTGRRVRGSRHGGSCKTRRCHRKRGVLLDKSIFGTMGFYSTIGSCGTMGSYKTRGSYRTMGSYRTRGSYKTEGQRVRTLGALQNKKVSQKKRGLIGQKYLLDNGVL